MSRKKTENMDKIPSFTIDHDRLLRGVYLSRQDRLGAETVSTFDIRLKEPNREDTLSNGAIHTIEHLGATFLRNDPEWKDKIVYFGPMGCLTGCYLLVHGNLSSRDVLDLVRRMFVFIAGYEGEIPGAAPRDCGCWKMHDLAAAKRESAKFLKEVLDNPAEANLVYPA